ncbi:MAG: acyl-CoA dehydrogenase family protein [Thermoplasmata archaeon]
MCLSEEQQILRGSIKDFVRRYVIPKEREIRNGIFPKEIIRNLGKNGFFNVMIPGFGVQDSYSYSLIVEEIASVSPSLAWIYATHVAAAYVISKMGNEAQRSEYIEKIADGRFLSTIAITESASGATASAVQTKAEKEGDSWKINGSKTFITMASEADLYIIMARSEKEKPIFTDFIVKGDDKGFVRSSSLHGSGLPGIGWGEISLENMEIGPDRVLGEEGSGLKIIPTVAKVFTIGAASISLGIMDALNAQVLDHIRERKINGAALLSFQSVQDKYMHMYSDDQAASALIYRAAINEDIKLSYAAKVFATERAIENSITASRLFGANGYDRTVGMPSHVDDAIAVPLHFINNDILTGLFINAL